MIFRDIGIILFQKEIDMSREEIKKSVCMWCKGECGILVKVRNKHLVDFESNPDYPRKIFPPSACIRRKNAKEYVYHPERIRYPMKRAGERRGKMEKDIVGTSPR